MSREGSHETLKRTAKQEEGQVEKTAPQAPTTVTRPVRRYRAYLFQVYVMVAAVAFGVLFFLARNVPYFSADLAITKVVQSVQVPAFDVLMRFVSGIGFNPLSYLLCGLLILYLYVVGLRWEAVMALFAAGGVTVMGALFKIIVQRARPTPDLVNVFSPLNDYSFPSGHVLVYTAFVGFFCFLIYTLAPHSWRRIVGIAVTALLVALVGLSRVYLGQHWPSDVLGAYLFGSLWLLLTVYLYRWGKPRWGTHQPAAPERPIPSAK